MPALGRFVPFECGVLSGGHPVGGIEESATHFATRQKNRPGTLFAWPLFALLAWASILCPAFSALLVSGPYYFSSRSTLSASTASELLKPEWNAALLDS